MKNLPELLINMALSRSRFGQRGSEYRSFKYWKKSNDGPFFCLYSDWFKNKMVLEMVWLKKHIKT